MQSRVQPSVQPRVQSRLLRVFLLQLALISLITVAGIFAASLVAERLLVNQALEGEASYFWNRRAIDSEFSLPNTLNLQSWFSAGHGVSAAETVPLEFSQLPLGQHRVQVGEDDRIVHVSERNDERLFLLFQDETVSDLAFYFGVVPLALTLLVMYSLAFLTYWLSKRAVSPIVRLSEVIEHFDFNARDASELNLRDLPGSKDSETVILAQALGHFVQRSKASIDRERNFTRYASHELRTPIAVIQGSIASLELVSLDGAAGRAVSRIKRSSEHMGQLINSLLLLARDSVADADSSSEPVNVSDQLETLIEEVQSVEPKDAVSISMSDAAPLFVTAPPVVLSIVLGNILRNAWKYTDAGQIEVSVEVSKVSIRDSGRGLNDEQQRRIFEPFYRIESAETPATSDGEAALSVQTTSKRVSMQGAEGLGLGLAIVQHFCNNHGWQLAVSSTLGEGSCFTVDFKPRRLSENSDRNEGVRF